MHEHLRNSTVYQNALRAPSAFALYPANWMKKKHLWPDHRVRTAAIRLDHLMTNALDPHYSYICRDHVSAMMTFLECFDRDLPRWNLSVQTRSMIEPRIAFCRQIIAQRQEDCTARGEEPPSSALFRETIIRNGGNIDEVVYDNPCYNYYHMSFFGHHSIISWVIIGAIQSEPLEKPETARRQAVVGRVMSAARDE